MPYITTAKARIVPPVFVETRHAPTSPFGLSLPFIAPIVIACFVERTVLKPIKSKVKRERTRVFVNPGRNVYFAVVTTISILKKPHKCYHVSCTNCGEFAHVAHRCYIQPIVKPTPEEQEDPLEYPMNFQFEADDDNHERGPPPLPVLCFADIEFALSEDRVFSPISFVGPVKKMAITFITQSPLTNF